MEARCSRCVLPELCFWTIGPVWPKISSGILLLVLVVFMSPRHAFGAEDPLILTAPMLVEEPAEFGNVIVYGAGELRVSGVRDPGVRFSGNVLAIEGGRVVFEDSVVQFLSEYHGQFALVALDGGEIEVRRCDYRVPQYVQHGIVTGGDGHALIEDSDFWFVQLVPMDESLIEARRLNGSFEVVVQNEAQVLLEDIPRDPGQGSLWVWPEFPSGSRAVYSPPSTGPVEAWSFPPPGSTGIGQHCTLRRCEVLLWPMLVREGCDLTLKDIPKENRVIVGLHLPNSLRLEGLVNQAPVGTGNVEISDRSIRLENASIDTWNVYPERDAEVELHDSVVGEALAFEASTLRLYNTVVDGTGGFFGSEASSTVTAENSTFTCDVQATGDSTLQMQNCLISPPEMEDPLIRVGAYDTARLLLAQTFVAGTDDGSTLLSLGGRGVLAIAALEEIPETAPGPGESVALAGWVGLYSLDAGLARQSWSLGVGSACGGPVDILASGSEVIDDGPVVNWGDADPDMPYRLVISLRDGAGRRLSTEWLVAEELIDESCAPRDGLQRPGF